MKAKPSARHDVKLLITIDHATFTKNRCCHIRSENLVAPDVAQEERIVYYAATI